MCIRDSKYSYKNVITAVQEKLKKKNIKLGYKSGFTQYVLNLIIDFYDIKQNSKSVSYTHLEFMMSNLIFRIV